MADLREALLHDAVHCSICNEIFNEPKQLTCLHTICQSCVTQLSHQAVGGGRGGRPGGVVAFSGVRSRTIICPICRQETSLNDIKADFKTNDLVARYQNAPLLKAEYPCEGCEQRQKEIEWKCTDCNMLICDFCREAHGKFRGTCDHRIISLSELARLTKDGLEKQKAKLEKANVTLESQQRSAMYHRDLVFNQKLAANAQIEADGHAILDLVTKLVTDHVDKMRISVENAVVTEMSVTQGIMAKIGEIHEKNKDSEKRIEEVLNCDDDRKVSHEAQHGLFEDPQIQNRNLDIKENLTFKLPNIVDDIVNQVKTGLRDVTLNKTEFGNPNLDLSPLVKGRFSKVPLMMQCSAEWQPVKKIELKQKIQRICMIGEHLWLPGYEIHVITVITQQCTLVKQVKHESLRFPMAVAVTSTGNIVVACGENKGLVELNRNAQYQRHIEATGSYVDISICGNEMAVLNSDSGLITIYQFVDCLWNKAYQITRDGVTNDPLDTILLHYGLLVVGNVKSDDEKRVAIYEKGKLLHKHIVQGEYVRICGIDQYQSIIVGHGRDNNLLVLRNTGETELLAVNGGVFYPLDVIFTDETTMFVLQKTRQGIMLIMQCTKTG